MDYEQLELIKTSYTDKVKNINGLVKKVYLLLHEGKENIITAQEIANIIGCTKDQVWKAIGELRIKYSIPIGSSKTNPGGYYIITNLVELKETLEVFNKEVKKKQTTRTAIIHGYYAKLRQLSNPPSLEH